LDKGFSELMKLQISQVNGCSQCINLQSKIGNKTW